MFSSLFFSLGTQAFSGLEAEALYVDTEGSFMAERAADIAEGLLKHLRRAGERNADKSSAAARLTVESLLSNIHYLRVHDWAQQLAIIASIDDYMKARGQAVGLAACMLGAVLDKTSCYSALLEAVAYVASYPRMQ